jgi:hypothetical protein
METDTSKSIPQSNTVWVDGSYYFLPRADGNHEIRLTTGQFRTPISRGDYWVAPCQFSHTLNEAYGKAEASFMQTFPDGFRIITASSSQNSSGILAAVSSFRSQHPNIIAPTAEELENLRWNPEVAENLCRADTDAVNSTNADELCILLYHWGKARGIPFQLGYLVEDGDPVLVTTHQYDCRLAVVWIYKLN